MANAQRKKRLNVGSNKKLQVVEDDNRFLTLALVQKKKELRKHQNMEYFKLNIKIFSLRSNYILKDNVSLVYFPVPNP